MKRVTGFALFFVAVGMLIKMFIDNDFISVIIILLLLIIGYNLFMSERCHKKP